MKKLETITTTEYKVTDIVCNGCGKPIPQDKYGHKADCLSVDKEWGYGSCFDGENHSFDLCDECYSEIIKNFKIPVEKHSYDYKTKILFLQLYLKAVPMQYCIRYSLKLLFLRFIIFF